MKKISYRLAGALIDSLRRIKPKKINVSAIILAAGSGTRMKCDKTKQWLLLDNLPVFVHSLKSFDACREIKEIILVVKNDELPMYKDTAEKYGIKKLKAIVPGGKTRADSALCGFRKISDKSSYVAVHDAARCLVTPEIIRKVISAALPYGCAAAACRASDTVKLCTDAGYVENTPDRSKIWLAQTPQVFETEIYRASAYLALSDGLKVTDDCSMAEHARFAVKLVDCGKENIKITEPVDLYFADAVLRKRKDDLKKPE